MLLQQTKEDIQSGGLGAGNSFTIAASSKAFEVLSNSLYQNKILAVIREITCNAADAHKVVGKAVSEIQVHLPTYAAPYFSVRDFGPGLSHGDVLSLYTTYFRSTKDQSNDLIGGFGLGSKSPFAVADQFTISVWQGGEARQYVCYKDGGVPAINHISTGPSDQPDGLEVRVGVSAGNFYRWEEEARSLFKWWPVVPAGIKVADYALSNTYCTLKSSKVVGDYPEWAVSGYTSSPVALMGGVPYALNFEAIVGLPPQIVQTFQGLGIVLCFEVGQLQISPSREALSYDPTTCRHLTDRLKSIYAGAVAEVQAKVATMPTLYDARRYVYGQLETSALTSLLTRMWGSLRNLTWKGQPVEQEVDVSWHKDLSSPVTVTRKTKASHRKSWDAGIETFAYDSRYQGLGRVGMTTAWFHEDTVTAKSYRKACYTSEQEGSTYTDTYGRQKNLSREVYIVSGVGFDEASKFFEAKGLPPLRRLADLPDVPKQAGVSRTGSTTKGYIFDWTRREWNRTVSPVDLTEPGYYVEFYDGEAVDFPKYVLQPFADLGLVDPAMPVVGLLRRSLDGKAMQAALAKHGWTKLSYGLLHSLPDATVQDAGCLEALGMARFSNWSHHEVGTYLGPVAAMTQEPTLLDFLYAFRSLRKVPATDKLRLVPYYKQHLSPAQIKDYAAGAHEVADLCAKWEDVIAKHPLLKNIAISQAKPADVADYINR